MLPGAAESHRAWFIELEVTVRSRLTTTQHSRTGLPQALLSTIYEAANRLTQRAEASFIYDENGNLTSDGANTCRRRLVQWQEADTPKRFRGMSRWPTLLRGGACAGTDPEGTRAEAAQIAAGSTEEWRTRATCVLRRRHAG